MSTHFIESCVRAAGLAPSIHNSQPWQFHAENRSVEVLLDMSRHLPVVDPDGREMMVSVGAALLNLRLALLAGGHVPLVRLLPGQPFTAARVIVGPSSAPTPTVRKLARAIERRHTTRSPFRSIAVPVLVQHELAAAAAAEGVRLEFLDPVRRDAMLALTFRAHRNSAWAGHAADDSGVGAAGSAQSADRCGQRMARPDDPARGLRSPRSGDAAASSRSRDNMRKRSP